MRTQTLYSTPNPENPDREWYARTKREAVSNARSIVDLDAPGEIGGYRESVEWDQGPGWKKTPHRYLYSAAVTRTVVAVGGRAETCGLLNGEGYVVGSEVIAYAAFDLSLGTTVLLTPKEARQRGLERDH